ncbi:hypothetical protein BJ742DRAFT_799619 [Cladochytrium replicatum]|nr:hypothetical protein BJ742DRAFT_799619 [Cladochytrium replicatum]
MLLRNLKQFMISRCGPIIEKQCCVVSAESIRHHPLIHSMSTTTPVTYNLLVSSIVNSLLVGGLLLDCVKYVLGVKTFVNVVNVSVVIAVVGLIVSQAIDAHGPLVSIPLGLFSGWIQLFGIWGVTLTCTMRSSTIHTLRPEFKWITYGSAALVVLVTLAVRVVNTVNDISDLNSDPSLKIPSNIRQALRVVLNSVALLAALYYELVTTAVIYDARNRTAEHGEVTSKRLKRPDKLVLFYTALITAVFLVQAILQLVRIWQPSTIAPFYPLGWSMLLKRIMEFKDEYKLKMESSVHSSMKTGQISFQQSTQMMTIRQ